MRIRDYFIVILYFLLVDYIWVHYCSTVWHAFFYLPSELGTGYRVAAYSIFAAPVIIICRKTRATSLITLLVFLLGYVPIIVSLINNYGGRENIIWIAHGFVLAAIMVGCFYIEKNTQNRVVNVRRKISIKFLIFSALLVLMIQLIFFRHNIRLVRLTDVYELREQNSANIPMLLRYVFSWSDTVLFPALFVIGTVYKKWRLWFLGLCALLFQYLIFGSKISLFLPVLLVATSKVLESKRLSDNLIKHFFVVVFVISVVLLSSYKSSELSYLLSAIILMRGLTIPGALYSGYYMPFFEDHTHTYFSHINVINKLTELYPYGDKPLGKVVSYNGMNANANFLAMDGVASGGLYGVFTVGIIFCFYIYLINRMVPKDRIKIFQLWMIVPTMALLNTSFFTFLLSEGALLIFIFTLYGNFKKNSHFWRHITVQA